MRMTLGRKVAVGFGTIVVVMGISFVVNRKATERVNQAQAQAVMLEDSAKLMIEKVVDHYKWLDGLNNTFARNRDKVEVQLDPTKCGLGKWLAGEEAAALSEQIPQIAELLGTIQSPHNQLHNSAKHIDTLCQSGSEEAREQARHIFLEETPTHLAGVQENLNAIRSELEAEADTQIHALSSSLEQMSSTALIVFIATVLMACTAGLLITRSVVKPIHLIVNRIKDIAEGEGDLTQRVDQDSRDELGELGQWFNTFVEKVHGIIADVAIGAREVAGASTQIAASSEEMASGMNEQAKQITQISSAVEEMTASVVEVSRKAADASTNATSAGELAEQGGQVVAETIDGMNSISEAVMSSATSVSELGKRGEQIGEIIKVINDIADQTNLLALNAAIEAARAGEHGRGFAVVADEVRKLADRTTKATEEIAGSITAIQQETGEAVERMNVGKTQVESGVERARDAGESLDKIVQSTQGVAGLIQSIAAAAEEQSAASEEISRSLESISAVTNESTEGATQSAQAASQLSTKAEQLQEIVSQFKLRENTASLETLAS